MPQTKRRKPAVDKAIGRILARLRKERGLTQSALAKRLDMPQSFISRYESGKFHLNPDLVLRIARILAVTPNDLLGWKKTADAHVPLGPRWAGVVKQIQRLPPRDRQALFRIIEPFLKSRARVRAS